MATGKFVAYYRVSTARQGRSGLGQAAQKESVAAYLNGGNWQLLAEYRDVESGKNDDRPELRRALDHCRMTGARLLIAKLDRLSRNVAFIAEMMQAGVKFTAVDMPDANELTIHIMAAVAQAERKAISERTRVALAAAKARGTKLGNPGNLRNQRKGSKRGNERKGEIADNAAALALAPIREARKQGARTLRDVADALNAAGYTTPRGAQWTATQVMRAEKRLAA
jgi:DNA invertase Pin-like site-specific DNA recombinase